MKRVNKYLAGVLSVLLLASMLVGCGSKSPSELIVGRWVLEGDTDTEWEFFSDGSVINSQGEANWSISEDSLKISDLGDTLVLDIKELTEDRLVVSNDSLDLEIVFEKVSN